VIRIQGSIEKNKEVLLACSGGVDSMAVADFLSRKHSVTLFFFNHGTKTSEEAQEFLQDFVSAQRNSKIILRVGQLSDTKDKGESWEEYWRNQRYKWFHSFENPVLTCHHLDDCVETWIWSSFHGQGKIIPFRNKNVIRPFRLTKKIKFVNWCRTKNVPWIEDESNSDNSYIRNFIRNEIVQKALIVNPGLHKVIAKKVEADEVFW
jgi:tRNA(Ile)-lysidine synthase